MFDTLSRRTKLLALATAGTAIATGVSYWKDRTSEEAVLELPSELKTMTSNVREAAAEKTLGIVNGLIVEREV